MKKFKPLALLVLLPILCFPFLGDVVNTAVVFVASAPSGSCTEGLAAQLVLSTGHLWTCQSITSGTGTWTDATGGGAASAITVGTTTIGGGTTQGLLYDNGGILGNLATANSGVLVTDSSGKPTISTTLPAVNGSAITSLNGSNIASGSVPVSYGGNGSNNYYVSGYGTSAGQTFTQNATTYFSFNVSNTITVGYIGFRVATADNTSNLYDLGIYTTAGTRLGHWGATAGSTAFPGTAVNIAGVALTGGPITLTPGTYLIAGTTNCASSCAVLAEVGAGSVYQYIATTGNTTTGGALLNTIATPSTSWGEISNYWFFVLHN